ncbi:MAG: hypothetical protein SFW66_02340 [Gammaproteobacteria bacterium]|nr:hypothetical protein [Gammaproteobacteria bacterium]
MVDDIALMIVTEFTSYIARDLILALNEEFNRKAISSHQIAVAVQSFTAENLGSMFESQSSEPSDLFTFKGLKEAVKDVGNQAINLKNAIQNGIDTDFLKMIDVIAKMPQERQDEFKSLLKEIIQISCQIKVAQLDENKDESSKYIADKKLALTEVVNHAIDRTTLRSESTKNLLLAIASFAGMVGGAILALRTGASPAKTRSGVGAGLAATGLTGCGYFGKSYIDSKKIEDQESQTLEPLRASLRHFEKTMQ